MEKIVNEIVNWLSVQINEAHAKGLIVGVSGGIDSAVVANLIKRASPHNSLGVIMPLKSNPVDMEHSFQVVQACDLKHVIVDLTETHEKMLQTIKRALPHPDEWEQASDKLTDANLRARLRMSTLYTLAANYQYLVVGTDNLAEWHTGYFTKYGDGGVDIQPIIDLTKREVIEMATYLQVPQAVIDKKPSADLWVGQTDEDELGTTYEMIDNYLDGIAIPIEDRKRIEAMHARTAHKRNIPAAFRFKV